MRFITSCFIIRPKHYVSEIHATIQSNMQLYFVTASTFFNFDIFNFSFNHQHGQLLKDKICTLAKQHINVFYYFAQIMVSLAFPRLCDCLNVGRVLYDICQYTGFRLLFRLFYY